MECPFYVTSPALGDGAGTLLLQVAVFFQVTSWRGGLLRMESVQKGSV
jgi:hypothetical protein